MADHVYSVHELTLELQRALEGAFPPLWIEGEVSNFRESPAGHWYFTLKDHLAQIGCVMWRSANLRQSFRPAGGVQARVYGTLTIYVQGGQYQIQVARLLPVGQGAFLLAFEQLRDRLRAEGLFDEARKRAIPAVPRHIGVITSPRGAAIRDILHVLGRRFPAVRVTLYPVLVQGDEAPAQIVRALDMMNRVGAADVLIVGRGGGSMEDLWAFNDERLVRAIAASRIPVISAVGHEVDVTLADFAADVRAPTPSAAAELAVPDRQTLLRQLAAVRSAVARAMRRRLDGARQETVRLASALSPRRRLEDVRGRAQRVDELARRLAQAGHRHIERYRNRVGTAAGALNALSPLATLERGYSICFAADGRVLRTARDVSAGDLVRVQMHRGRLECTVSRCYP
jgi:exodeoxyribonuclease VII large subunit